jgi:hypothetical protein
MAVLLPRKFGITLTPSAAIVHNLRRRIARWSEVQAITIESLLGSRTIVLYDTNGDVHDCAHRSAACAGIRGSRRRFTSSASGGSNTEAPAVKLGSGTVDGLELCRCI